MNAKTARAERTPAAIIPICLDTYVRDGYDGPGLVATHAYMRLCVEHTIDLDPEMFYLVIWDENDVAGAANASLAQGLTASSNAN